MQHTVLEDLLEKAKVKYEVVDISGDDLLVDYLKNNFQLPFVVGNGQMLGGEEQVRQLVESGQVQVVVGEENIRA